MNSNTVHVPYAHLCVSTRKTKSPYTILIIIITQYQLHVICKLYFIHVIFSFFYLCIYLHPSFCRKQLNSHLSGCHQEIWIFIWLYKNIAVYNNNNNYCNDIKCWYEIMTCVYLLSKGDGDGDGVIVCVCILLGVERRSN